MSGATISLPVLAAVALTAGLAACSRPGTAGPGEGGTVSESRNHPLPAAEAKGGQAATSGQGAAAKSAPEVPPTSIAVPPPSAPAAEGAFGWTGEVEPATGWTIYTLRQDGGEKSQRKVARICPQGGANLFSFVVGGLELLVQPDDIRKLRGGGSGTPILYPTPNRIRDGRFVFENQGFAFRDDGKIHIHGLVRELGWQSEPPRVHDICVESPGGGVELKTWIDFEPGSAHFARFPYRHTLTVRYVLTANGVRIWFTVENRDRGRLPFGFALHPYFALHGERAQTFLRVPAQRRMDATPDLLPTGELQPLDGAPFDLRKYRPLSELALDDVFWGLRPAQPLSWEARDARVRMDLPASEHFTHAVIFTPKDRPLFCMENQTCSTDAHNLHAQGKVEEAHLLIVEPGQSVTGWVDFRAARF